MRGLGLFGLGQADQRGKDRLGKGGITQAELLQEMAEIREPLCIYLA